MGSINIHLTTLDIVEVKLSDEYKDLVQGQGQHQDTYPSQETGENNVWVNCQIQSQCECQD